ncbi:hypothetical protein [Alteromonas sp. OM2203]|uniref:hypothetical protein n=1 Tax=Alteromonas sp. OM2203 TaxID=3398817 RepID=UPI003AF3BC92
MKKENIVLMLALTLPAYSYAGVVSCNDMTVKNVTVEGKRDDGFYFENKLIVEYNQPCAGKKYTHTNLSNPAFNGFLSIALAAKSTDSKVEIAINSSNTTPQSNQLAYISIK